MSPRKAGIAIVALMLLTAFLDDGPAIAAAAEIAYCQRVAAGMHTDFKNLCHGDVK